MTTTPAPAPAAPAPAAPATSVAPVVAQTKPAAPSTSFLTSIDQFMVKVVTAIWNAIQWVAGKVKSMLLALFSAVASPLLRIVIYAVLALSFVTGLYLKGRYDEHKVMEYKAQVALAAQKKEMQNEIAAANAAREEALRQFNAGQFRNRPSRVPGRVRHGSDGWARD